MLKTNKEIIEAFFQEAVDTKAVVMELGDSLGDPARELFWMVAPTGSAVASFSLSNLSGKGVDSLSVRSDDGATMTQLLSEDLQARVATKDGRRYLYFFYKQTHRDGVVNQIYSFDIKDSTRVVPVNNDDAVTVKIEPVLKHGPFNLETVNEFLSRIRPETFLSIETFSTGNLFKNTGFMSSQVRLGNGFIIVGFTVEGETPSMVIYLFKIGEEDAFGQFHLYLINDPRMSTDFRGERSDLFIHTPTMTYNLECYQEKS